MKTILVPLALPGGTSPALAFAANLARGSQTRLVLLHAVQLGIAGEERGVPRARLLQELLGKAKTQLEESAAAVGAHAEVEILVCEGRPAEAIIETARRLGADAIVIHRHRHRSWLAWLHRNTALSVAREAPCRTWLVSPGIHPGALHLVAVDNTRCHGFPGAAAVREEASPSRSLLRVLFS